MVLIIQISNGNNIHWNKIQFQTCQKKQPFDMIHKTCIKVLLSKICKKRFHIISICCRAYNHHLQKIHAHCHWETCGFGIHMGPHNQCRALLVWTHVTLKEQKLIIIHCKRNTLSSLSNLYFRIFSANTIQPFWREPTHNNAAQNNKKMIM